DGRNKRYRIGPKLFSLAASASEEAEYARAVEPYLEDLARRSGETSHLAVRTGSLVSVLARRVPDSPVQISERPGVTRPAHATATGKVLLAAMEPEDFERLLATMPLDTFTPTTVTDRDRLREEVRQARDSGIAGDDGEFHREVRCIAVPVTGYRSRRMAALGISAPVYRLSMAELRAKEPLLRDTAAEISRALGQAQG
ncbi:MAG: IclR family transcriptional regulator, partial [Acetobacterales bacterium]